MNLFQIWQDDSPPLPSLQWLHGTLLINRKHTRDILDLQSWNSGQQLYNLDHIVLLMSIMHLYEHDCHNHGSSKETKGAAINGKGYQHSKGCSPRMLLQGCFSKGRSKHPCILPALEAHLGGYRFRWKYWAAFTFPTCKANSASSEG